MADLEIQKGGFSHWRARSVSQILWLSRPLPVTLEARTEPYSGKFSLVQIFAEKRADSSEEIFAVFIFRGCGTLWPHPYQLMAMPHMRNGTERQSEEASLCNNGLIFLLCGGFRNYDGIKTATAGEKQARWIQHC